MSNKFDSKVLTIKVTNLDTGREDIHKNISPDEIEWIKLNPNLRVDIVEVSPRRSRRYGEDG